MRCETARELILESLDGAPPNLQALESHLTDLPPAAEPIFRSIDLI
jgi:hypothetical protein